MVLLKLNIISNHFFKSIGFKFFLKNKKIDNIEEKSKNLDSTVRDIQKKLNGKKAA